MLTLTPGPVSRSPSLFSVSAVSTSRSTTGTDTLTSWISLALLPLEHTLRCQSLPRQWTAQAHRGPPDIYRRRNAPCTRDSEGHRKTALVIIIDEMVGLVPR